MSVCSGHPRCVDWVEHRMNNMQDSNRICGVRKAAEIHSNGANEMLVEQQRVRV